VRPGMLTDEKGTGRVRIGERLDRGKVARDDVAAVLDAVLHANDTIGKAFDLVGGDDPIEDAIRRV